MYLFFNNNNYITNLKNKEIKYYKRKENLPEVNRVSSPKLGVVVVSRSEWQVNVETLE